MSIILQAMQCNVICSNVIEVSIILQPVQCNVTWLAMLATCPASLSAASPMKVKLFSLAITFFASSIISVMKA